MGHCGRAIEAGGEIATMRPRSGGREPTGQRDSRDNGRGRIGRQQGGGGALPRHHREEGENKLVITPKPRRPIL